MIKIVLALLGILAGSQVQAAGETLPTFGLSPGASPNTVCIFDLSASRPCVTIGTLDSVLHTFASTPAGINTSRTLNYVTGPTLPTTAFYYNGNANGTCDGSITNFNQPDCSLAYMIFNDTVNAGARAIPAFEVVHMIGASSSQSSGFIGIYSLVDQFGTTGGPIGTHNYIGIGTVVHGTQNDGGTVSVANATIFGIVANTLLGPNATFWNQIIGEEIDVAAGTGASVLDKIGMQIVETSSDGVKGSNSNVALSLNSWNGAAAATGWDCGFCFGAFDGYNPMNAGSTLIGSFGHAGSVGGGAMGTVTNGVDFSRYTFTGSAFKSTGFSVDGTGIVTGASYKAGATAGVTCSGSPTASFASTGGIVTHC